MSSRPTHPSAEAEEALLQQLRRLPAPSGPSPALWQRIDHSLARRRRRRRAGGALALAAALSLALVLPGPWRTQPAPQAEGVAMTEPADALDPIGLAALRSELRHIDRELEAAYLGGEEREQIARLWQLRQRIEKRIEDPSHAPPQLIHL